VYFPGRRMGSKVDVKAPGCIWIARVRQCHKLAIFDGTLLDSVLVFTCR